MLNRYYGGGGVGGAGNDHPLSNNGARPGIEGGGSYEGPVYEWE